MENFELKYENFVVECKTHGKSEVRVLGCLLHGTPPRCPACVKVEERYNQRLQKMREEEAFFRRNQEALRRSGIPKRYLNLEWEDFDQTQNEDSRAVYLQLREYAEIFNKIITHGRSLLLCGGTGTGKTMLACLVARHVINNGYSAIYASASQVFEDYKETFTDQTKKKNAVLQKYSHPSLLIVDEVGVQFGSETERNIISEIIRLRYDDLKPTVFISNYDPETVRGFLGDRVMSRLAENGGGKIDFTWPDFRARRKQQ